MDGLLYLGQGDNMKKTLRYLFAAAVISGVAVFASGCGETLPHETTGNSSSELTETTTESTPETARPLADSEVVSYVEDHILALRNECAVEVFCGDASFSLTAAEVNAPYSRELLEKTLEDIGYGPELLERYDALRKNAPEYEIDEQLILDKLTDFYTQVKSMTESSYSVNERTLTINVGEKQRVIKPFATKSEVVKAFEEFRYGRLEAKYDENNPYLDWAKVVADVTVEAKDAYYEYVSLEKNAVIVPETDGYTVDLEEIKKAYAAAAPGEVLTFAAHDTKPEITTETIDSILFCDEISSYTTYFNTNEYSRSENIRLASKSIDGAVILPGERFSFNSTVGERTKERGYKEATVYVGGTMEPGLGGGICQVSSTVYCASLRGAFTQVYRYNHQFTITYVPLGEDATVYWGALDYSFRNNYDSPIKILMEIDGGSLTVRIMGKLSDDSYSVQISHETVEEHKQKMVYKQDNSLKPGEEKLSRRGKPGYEIKTTVVTYKNGSYFSQRTYTDDYDPYNGLTYRGPLIETTENTTKPTTPTETSTKPTPTAPPETSTKPTPKPTDTTSAPATEPTHTTPTSATSESTTQPPEETTSPSSAAGSDPAESNAEPPTP